MRFFCDAYPPSAMELFLFSSPGTLKWFGKKKFTDFPANHQWKIPKINRLSKEPIANAVNCFIFLLIEMNKPTFLLIHLDRTEENFVPITESPNSQMKLYLSGSRKASRMLVWRDKGKNTFHHLCESGYVVGKWFFMIIYGDIYEKNTHWSLNNH